MDVEIPLIGPSVKCLTRFFKYWSPIRLIKWNKCLLKKSNFLRLIQATNPLPLAPGLHVHWGWWLAGVHVASCVHVSCLQTGTQVWLRNSQAWSSRQSWSTWHSTLIQATRGFPCSPTGQTQRAWWKSTRHSAPLPQGVWVEVQGFTQCSWMQVLSRGQSLSTRHSARKRNCKIVIMKIWIIKKLNQKSNVCVVNLWTRSQIFML